MKVIFWVIVYLFLVLRRSFTKKGTTMEFPLSSFQTPYIWKDCQAILFFHAHKSIWINIHAIVFFSLNYTHCSWSLSPEMVVLYHESLPPCHSCPAAFVAYSPAIHLLPFPFPWEIWTENTKNIPKYPKNRFRPFFPPSEFHFSILGNQLRKRFWVLLSHFRTR